MRLTHKESDAHRESVYIAAIDFTTTLYIVLVVSGSGPLSQPSFNFFYLHKTHNI